MDADVLFNMRQLNCQHEKQESYNQRRFDILTGFDYTLTRCMNCHKIVGLEAKKFSKH